MPNWTSEPSDPNLLRLYVPGEGWKAYRDKLADDGKVEGTGGKRAIESALLNALNATNLLVLTGAGSSFSAKNAAGKSPASMHDLWSAVRTKVGNAAFDKICDMFPSSPINQNIEKLLTLCKLHLELHENATDRPTTDLRDFVRDAEAAILDRVDFVDAKTELDAHASFIQKIGRRGLRKPRAKFFTTNYDLCFEEAARRHRFTIVDGFSHALDQVYDRSHFDHDIVRRDTRRDAPDYIENVFHLYKVHGSIDWRRVDGDVLRSRGPHGLPVLIFPRSSKYQEAFEAPYLDMISSLQGALREPDTGLMISGFGFNDDHLSRPLLAAIEANMSLRVTICDPVLIPQQALSGDPHIINAELNTSNPFLKAFFKLAASGDPRIHLINGRFGDLAAALPDLVGETDRERHMARIRAIRDEQVASG